jgi:hypothetical protein
MIKYIEHRIWFLGHIFSEDCFNQKDSNEEKISKKYFFNEYSEYGEKITCEEKYFDKDIDEIAKAYNKDYGLEFEKITYNFLNNGCVSILTEYIIKDNENKFICDYDHIAGRNFTTISKLILKRLEIIIDQLSKYLMLNNSIKWGIPNLLIDDKDLAMNSVLFIQNFVFDETSKKLFLKEINNFPQNQIINYDFSGKNIKKPYTVYIDWGKRFWYKEKIKIDESFELGLLDSDIVYLSKKVIAVSQLNISTYLSQRILYDENIRNEVSVEALELYISSYRTLSQSNELISQDFDEFTYKYNEICVFSDNNLKEIIETKNNSEITLIQLAKYYESKRFEKFNKVIQGILTTIAILTIYSVANDIASFLPIEEDKPIQNLRMEILLVITSVILIAGIYLLKKVKKN